MAAFLTRPDEAARAAPPAGQVPARQFRLDFIEGMRAAAALTVLFNHAYAQTWNEARGDYPEPALGFLTYALVVGHLAVSIFICISGFCLMLPVARSGGTLVGGPVVFFRKRARRILPPYFAALFGSLLLIATIIGEPTGSLWDVSIAVRPQDIASHLLLLQDVFGTGRINYAFWSIALEWQLYFAFPLLIWAFRRLGVLKSVLGALLVGYAIGFASGETRLARANVHFLGLFALGMSAAWVATSSGDVAARLRRSVPWAGSALVIAAPMPFLLIHWGWLESISWWPLLDLLSATATACALIAGATDDTGLIRRVFAFPPLVFVGSFSYSLYLIHAPLLQVIWQHILMPLALPPNAIFVALLTGGTLLIVGASWLFYLAFERPFIRANLRATLRVTPTLGQNAT